MGFRGIRYELGQGLLCEYDTSGILKTQPDGAGDAPRLGSYETLHPLGFAARAPAAKPGPSGAPLSGGGCKVRVGYDGTDIQIELLGDHRDLARIPPLPAEGGAVMYAPGCPVPSFHVIHSDDGTHQIYVEIGDSSHVFTVGIDANGDSIIELTHADGMGVLLQKKKALVKNAKGDCYIELNDSGGVLNGNWKVQGDITDPTGISLFKHTHLTAMGPSTGPQPSLV